jgi:Sigma-70, region 4
MDLQQISSLLRRLPPRQEKVIRLRFGLGCRRAHSAAEVAEQFGVSAQVMGGLLRAALRRLAEYGVTPSDLRQAAQWQQNQSAAIATAASGRRKCSPSRSPARHPPSGTPE